MWLRDNETIVNLSQSINSKNQNFYWSLVFLITSLMLFTSVTIRFTEYFGSYGIIVSNIYITLSTSLIIANVVQFMKDKILRENFKTDVKSIITDEVNKVIEVKHRINPRIIYWFNDLALERERNTCLNTASTLRFMSISAKQLVNEKIELITDESVKKIYILLLNPANKDLVSLRCRQMSSHGEAKNEDQLIDEILNSIYKAYLIAKRKTNLTIFINFHNEVPVFRTEIYDNDLFLSYFESQKEKDFGPVARYTKENSHSNDIYKSLLKYFEDVWGRNTAQIELNKFDGVQLLKDRLNATYSGLSVEIEEIFKS